MAKSRIILIMVLATAVLSSCRRSAVYSEFQTVSRLGWPADSALRFDVSVPDTTATYDLNICVRHTTEYPYQNLWLFIDFPDGTDTLEVMLADQRGQWFGSHNGSNYELTVSCLSGAHLPAQSTIAVRHGMRMLELTDITDIGLEVSACDGQE